MHGVALHVRIAVHTGPGRDRRRRDRRRGLQRGRAAQQLAPPDTLLIGEDTYALVAGHFDVEERGLAELREVPRPMATYTVLGERAGGRLAASPSARRSPAVSVSATGSSDALRDATEGDGSRGVLVRRGAGLGKSRTILEAANAAGAGVLLCRARAVTRSTSLHVPGVLEQACGIDDGDDAEQRLA